MLSVSPGDIDNFHVIIEIPAEGGQIKYEYDKELGFLTVDRFMPTSMRYPCNYGFVPNTLAEDGDPLDVLVLTPAPVQPGTLMRVRAIGMMNMEDESGKDDKILALPTEKACLGYKRFQSIEDIPSDILDRIIHFFENYKALESNKWVKVAGWVNKAEAEKVFQASIDRFSK